MNRKHRDYRAEYLRRIERGFARGLSRSQARGHPKPHEPTVRPVKSPEKSALVYDARLEAGLHALRSGKSLTESARSIHVSPERLRRYAVRTRMVRRRGRKWIVGRDRRRRQMLLYSNGEAIVVTVRPDAAHEIGAYMSAVGRFLASNDPAFLAPFRRKWITDTSGMTHSFETDPNTLYELEGTGAETFEDVYRTVA
ncbi:MAG: hypothetical protein M0002_10595 [Rhodospirillales bacterium]|nr:hypothetical protein [Rhodospirillales bacterium]